PALRLTVSLEPSFLYHAFYPYVDMSKATRFHCVILNWFVLQINRLCTGLRIAQRFNAAEKKPREASPGRDDRSLSSVPAGTFPFFLTITIVDLHPRLSL